MTSLTIEFTRVFGVSHPVIHIYIGQAVEQKFKLGGVEAELVHNIKNWIIVVSKK